MTAEVTATDGDHQVVIAAEETVAVTGNVAIEDRLVGLGDAIQEIPEPLREPLVEVIPLADSSLVGPTLRERFIENAASAGYDPGHNVCFGCAETPDALQLFKRVAPDGELWTRWQIEPGFIDARGRLASAMVVAALDCSNLWVLNGDNPRYRLAGGKIFITGSFAVHFLRVPPIDMPGDYRVVARQLRTEGRKGFTMSVLLDERGAPYAVAESTAILIDTPAELELNKLAR